MILPTDKGRSTVVKDETEYYKVNSLLAGHTVYKVLDKDPTPSTERKMNNTVGSKEVRHHPLSQLTTLLNDPRGQEASPGHFKKGATKIEEGRQLLTSHPILKLQDALKKF